MLLLAPLMGIVHCNESNLYKNDHWDTEYKSVQQQREGKLIKTKNHFDKINDWLSNLKVEDVTIV